MQYYLISFWSQQYNLHNFSFNSLSYILYHFLLWKICKFHSMVKFPLQNRILNTFEPSFYIFLSSIEIFLDFISRLLTLNVSSLRVWSEGTDGVLQSSRDAGLRCLLSGNKAVTRDCLGPPPPVLPGWVVCPSHCTAAQDRMEDLFRKTQRNIWQKVSLFPTRYLRYTKYTD